MKNLISPYKGCLVNSLLDDKEAEKLKHDSESFPSITLTKRQECDLELLLNGSFSPLSGFMAEDEYQSVLSNSRLLDNTLWPMPVYLDVDSKFAEKIGKGTMIALRDTEGFMPAVLTVTSIWTPDKDAEANAVYGTTSKQHPGVRYLYDEVNDTYIGGTIQGVQLPFHYDFEYLRHTPQSLRQEFTDRGWERIIGFHTSKPMHKVHVALTEQAAKKVDANILIHPVVGLSKPGDIHYYARVHCYQAIQKYLSNNAIISLIPMAVRMAGPREALMNAIIRQNYGCTHYIVGTQHATPPNNCDIDPPFYPSHASQEYLQQFKDELGIKIIPVDELSYDVSKKKYITSDTKNNLSSTSNSREYTHTNVLNAITHNITLPDWVTYPEVIREISKVCPPRDRKGITLFFTGLSGSGKSTLARIIYAKFIEDGHRAVTLLDGDEVRTNLSSELGFSKKDRNINVKRIGYVASEITKNMGVAICAPIAPYTESRRHVRSLIETYGAFIEIHVSTPLEICEQRDRKGLYKKARKGLIPEFTGISDPYEVPEHPEIRINTGENTPREAAQVIYDYLTTEGYIRNN